MAFIKMNSYLLKLLLINKLRCICPFSCVYEIQRQIQTSVKNYIISLKFYKAFKVLINIDIFHSNMWLIFEYIAKILIF